MTDVVAALIWQGNHFLACQRPAHKARGLLWEFVGGKVEPGETKEEALVRECKEELGITVSVHNVFTEVDHIYPDITIHLTLFHASISDGIPQKLEHNDLRWITVDEIPSYNFCPADKEILHMIICSFSDTVKRIRCDLIHDSDPAYKAFQSKLVPNIDQDTILGIRVPLLRKYAKSMNASDTAVFLNALPHMYYDENILHGILLSESSKIEELTERLDDFLPYVDNWAVCDVLAPRILRQQTRLLYDLVLRWLRSQNTYTIRFAVGMLLKYCMDDAFLPAHLTLVANIQSDEYYINMMRAWYFATALAKQYGKTISILENQTLDPWTHNKTIQKAIESYRLSAGQKDYLRTLKRKC